MFEADVDDALLGAGGGGPGLGWRAASGTDISATLLTFGDPDPNATVGLYNSIITWGDGYTANGTIAQTGSSFSVTGDHTYNTPGSRTIGVNVMDVGGATVGTSIPIDVDAEPPTVLLQGAYANEGEICTLTASVIDPDASSVSYAWSIAWGDGSATDTPVGPPGTFTHLYTEPGSYSIVATASDTLNGLTYASAPATFTAGISEAPPTSMSITGNSTIAEGDTYVLGGSFVDPDGDLPDEWLVNWGDGSGLMTYGSADAVLDESDAFGGPAGAEHTYAKGTYAIYADPVIEGNTYVGGTQTVTVTDATPTFSVIGDSTFTKGQLYSVTAGYSDFDSPTGWSIAWGDNQTDSGTGAIPATLTHTYATGTSPSYTIAANVTTVDGTYTNLSTVAEAEPTVSISGPASTTEGATYSLTGSFSDPNGNSITGWSVDWGDGTNSTLLTHVYSDYLNDRAQMRATFNCFVYEQLG